MSELSSLAIPLKPFARVVAKAVVTHARQLQAERKAGRQSFQPQTSVMDSVFSETLDRLRGGKVDSAWWSNLLSKLGQKYIAPDFLRETALQKWIASIPVAGDLKTLATAQIMSGRGNDSIARDRLARSFSHSTGEAQNLATGPINVIVAILVAGYIASIPSDQRAVFGAVQNLSEQIHERFDHLKGSFSPTDKDPITQEAHTERVDKELSKILIVRTFDPLRARRNIQELFQRVGEKGDLYAASSLHKKRVFYWTSRLCASDSKMRVRAAKLRDRLRQIDPGMDLSILDALLAESGGDANKALRLLRDNDDPDSRANVFGLLVRSQGETAALDWYSNQAAHSDSQFFTANGWKNWRVCMAKIGKWEEAAKRLRCFDPDWPEMPVLALVEGVVNAAMLLPEDHRERALQTVPIYEGVTPNLVVEAGSFHSRAATCFKFAEHSLKDIADHDLSEFIVDWRRWIRLMDPNSENTKHARDVIRKEMDEGESAVKLIPFTYAFDIPFNMEPLRQYLKQRKQFGGLNDRELIAECLLSKLSMSPGNLVTYLEQNKRRLHEVMPIDLLTTTYAEALVRDNQTERARGLVQETTKDISHVLSSRLTVMIDAHEGKDPRKQLEFLYQQSKGLTDLKNLVSYLESVNDRSSLRCLLRELFNRERTVENALGFIKCFVGPSFFDHAAIIQFTEQNPDILERSNDLQSIRARALFNAGRIQQSKEINDKLLHQRLNTDDFHLDVAIAISAGDWERIPAILDREWPRRSSHSAETLMVLAQLASQLGQTTTRAIVLSKLAAKKAPDDPRILVAAYGLYFQLGRESEADPDWIKRASDLSSAEKGPIWRISMQDLAEDWIPKRRDHMRDVQRKWLSGEIPISFAVERFNQSLAHLLLHIPDQNNTELDGRRRVILPIISGERSPIELQEDWTIGLDVSSIMVLSYLGLLETAINAFSHVKLSPDVVELLFRENFEVRFHQPSRIKEAKQVRELQSREQLGTVDHFAATPKVISEEVGLELASLLQTARHVNGKVVCVLPIHKVGSLLDQKADTHEYDDLIISTMDLCRLCHDEGKVDTDVYQRAKSFLRSQGQAQLTNPAPSFLESPIFVDQLALSYLQRAEILQPIATSGLDIRIHPDSAREAQALIETGDLGDELVKKIGGVRAALRNALDSGAASFLPRTVHEDSVVEKGNIKFQVTASLLTSGSPVCDAICCDDRCINKHLVCSERDGRVVPIVCILDVLRFLVSRGSISTTDHWGLRHKLRQGGFIFVPLESEELIHWLKASRVKNSSLKESAELRVLRQTIARIDSLELTNPKEITALSSSLSGVCKDAIASLWRDESLTVERVTILSDWVWHQLLATPLADRQQISLGSYEDCLRDMTCGRLGQFLLPTIIRSRNRRKQLTNWIEQAVLEPMRTANADLIEQTITLIRNAISKLDEHQAYGQLFLANLPESLRRLVLSHDPEFGRRLGFVNRTFFRFEEDLKIEDNELFAAAREMLAKRRSKTVLDIAGKQITIILNKQTRNVVVQWSNTESVSHERTFPQLALLSPERKARIDGLRRLIKHCGPTALDFQQLHKNLQVREANNKELSAASDELSNGVAALQSNLVRKFTHGMRINTEEFIPQSVSYYERFAGPSPGTREPESYFREVLVRYRRKLLNQNLNVGLDICCLGALRDDLTPGQWVSDIDDDTIWQALSSCHADSNPFSLLGALDVALYRQGDRRFRDFSEKAVSILLDERLGRKDDLDIYRLLQVTSEFVLNRLNLLENRPNYPGNWKRMCALMQAGLIARAMAELSPSINVDAFEEWTHENMVVAGAYAKLIDATKEPMIFASRMTREGLRNEILGRLHLLKSRHERVGRSMPLSEKINEVLVRGEGDGPSALIHFPGPLEGHRRPSIPIPEQVAERLNAARTDSGIESQLHLLLTASQLFAFGKLELEYALRTVNAIEGHSSDDEPGGILKLLELASILAAANRDTKLADRIADIVAKIASGISRGEDALLILQIMLQSAIAYEVHDAWFKWLEERLASVAVHLPSLPNECLQVFRNHLYSLGAILPTGSWFHIRALSIASSGSA